MSSAINVGVLTLSSAKAISKYLKTFDNTLFNSKTANLCPMPEIELAISWVAYNENNEITVARSCGKWDVREMIRFVGGVFRKESFWPKFLWIGE